MINEGSKDEKQKELMVRELGVFELRGLARELGIASPTTKKREELIDSILNIVKNGESIEHTGKRKGRPYKKLSSIDEIVSSMTNEYNTVSDIIEFESLLTFAQEMPIFGNFDNTEMGIFEGIIRTNNEDYFSFYDKTYDKWVFIRNDIENYDKLNTGDKVKVEAKGLGNQSQYEAVKILLVNETEINKYIPIVFDKGEEIISDDKIYYANGEVKIGRRNAYKKIEDIYENDNFHNLTENCVKGKFKLITLGLNTSFEDQIVLKKEKNIENFTTVYGTKCMDNFNMVIDAINYCQRLIDVGEKVVLYIADIITILRSVNECFAKDCDEYSEQSLVVVRKLLSLGRAYKNNNCTLIVCYSELDANDKFLVNDVLKISKNIN